VAIMRPCCPWVPCVTPAVRIHRAPHARPSWNISGTRDPRLRGIARRGAREPCLCGCASILRRGEEPEDLRQVRAPRVGAGGRPLRPIARARVLDVRDADDRRHAEAALPRSHVGRAAASSGAGNGIWRSRRLGEELTHELGRAPTVAELAAHGKWSEAQVHQALDAAYVHRQA